jgi:Rrf2 family protein
MLKLTKKADYGLIAMRHLASDAGCHSQSAKDLADAYAIPQQALAKILQKLVKAGLLISHHGTNGGYALARKANAISAFEVIKAIDGPVFMTSCYTRHGECGQSAHCTVREPLRKVSERIEEVLTRMKLSDLAISEAASDEDDQADGHKASGRAQTQKPDAAELVRLT